MAWPFMLPPTAVRARTSPTGIAPRTTSSNTDGKSECVQRDPPSCRGALADSLPAHAFMVPGHVPAQPRPTESRPGTTGRNCRILPGLTATRRSECPIWSTCAGHVYATDRRLRGLSTIVLARQIRHQRLTRSPNMRSVGGSFGSAARSLLVHPPRVMSGSAVGGPEGIVDDEKPPTIGLPSEQVGAGSANFDGFAVGSGACDAPCGARQRDVSAPDA